MMSTLLRAASAVLAASALGGCAIVLTDVTPPMVYNPTDNTQTIAVRATPRGSSAPIGSVEVTVDGAAPRAMAPAPLPGDSNRYAVSLRFPDCQEVVEYSFYAREAGTGIRGSARAPRTGVFRQPITDTETLRRPPNCQTVEDMNTQREAYIVNAEGDGADANPGDGICDTRVSGSFRTCTLRAAVMEANASRGADVILLVGDAESPSARRYMLSIAGDDGATPDAARGDLDITEAVTIRGVWPDDASIVRALRYSAGAPASINFADEPLNDGIITKIDAGRIDRIFDIHTSSASDAPVVRIENLILTNGRAPRGGAIFNRGRLAVSRAGFVSNSALASLASGVVSDGGAIYNFAGATLDINDAAFFRNDATPTTGSTGASNGGALLNQAAGNVTINRSVFAVNRANAGSAISNLGRLDIRATSIVENESVDTRARAAALDNSGTASISFTSFDVNNLRAIRTGTAGGGSLTIDSSLITGFGSGDLTCDGGVARSLGGNRLGDVACPRLSLLESDRAGIFTPRAETSLADAGGLLPVWWFRRPLSGLTDTIDPASSLTCNAAIDQRGVPRPLDADGDGRAWCDAGAYERRPTD